MKWRHWAILIVLVLLNYIIFSTAFTQLARQRQPVARGTRTPMPTFENITPSAVAWVVLPTSTPRPTKTPLAATPTLVIPTPTRELATAAALSMTAVPEATATTAPPTATAMPPTAEATGEVLVHVIKRGETLSEIAKEYGVTVQAIVDANELENPNKIITGQKLIIPLSGNGAPSVNASTASKPQATNTPKPKPPTATPTRQPPTATPAPAAQQFTAEIVWDPLVAPNCSGPAISKQSIIRDTAGNPVDGVLIKVDCYGNSWVSHPSGNPGEYEPGHYDFYFGQSTPQDWTCTAWVIEVNGQAATSSQVVTIQFDTNSCKPHGDGHQVAIVNWTKHW